MITQYIEGWDRGIKDKDIEDTWSSFMEICGVMREVCRLPALEKGGIGHVKKGAGYGEEGGMGEVFGQYAR